MGKEGENIVGGYTDDKGNIVTQQMTTVSGIQTIVTKVENPTTGATDIYVDKALDSNMKEYAQNK
jgi:hypothetical protein